MLREKQLELARLQKEVEALRLVAGMIGQESNAENNGPNFITCGTRDSRAAPGCDSCK